MLKAFEMMMVYLKTTPEQRVLIKNEVLKVKESEMVHGLRRKVSKKNGLLMLEIKAVVRCAPYWTEMCEGSMGYATATDKVINIRL